MPLVSVTRLQLRSRRYLPRLACDTWLITRQARRADGFLKGRLFRGSDRPLLVGLLFGRLPSFWTMTMWADRDSMLAFRNDGAHRDVLPKFPEWGREASTVNWEQDSLELPDMEEAHRRMAEDGELMSLRYPSDAHASGEVPPDPDVRGELPLRPVE